MTIVNPIVPTYASRTPYLTPAEYTASPTGVDVSSLVAGGSAQQNADALAQTIARASSWVDTECRKILAATLDTQAGRYRVSADNTIRIPLDNTPIVAVVDVSVGSSQAGVQLLPATTIPLVEISRKTITVPVQFPAGAAVAAVVHYVNGYANSLLSGAAAAGATTIAVDSTLGIIPGMQVTIYDPGATEQVTVVAVAGNAVTLAAPLLFQHQADVAVSALPPAIKQATVLKTSALIKTRGDSAFVMPSLGSEPTQKQTLDPSGSGDETIAAELLAPFRRVA